MKVAKKQEPAAAPEIEMDPTPAPPPPPRLTAPPPVTTVSLAAQTTTDADPLAPKTDPGDGATTVTATATATAGPHKEKHWHVAAGVLVLDPLSSSGPLTLSNVVGPASLAVQNGPIVGSGVSVESVTLPAIMVGYDLPYWHRKLTIETVLATPVTVKFDATGTLATKSLAPTVLGIPTGVPALGTELGQAQAVPPLVTLVYSPWRGRALQPYVGAGATVMFTYGAKVTNPILTEVNQPSLSVPPAPGFVMQAGVTVPVVKGVYARFDVKFVAGLVANAEVTNINVKTPDLPLISSVQVGNASMSVTVNPLIVQAVVGYDF